MHQIRKIFSNQANSLSDNNEKLQWLTAKKQLTGIISGLINGSKLVLLAEKKRRPRFYENKGKTEIIQKHVRTREL